MTQDNMESSFTEGSHKYLLYKPSYSYCVSNFVPVATRVGLGIVYRFVFKANIEEVL